MRGDAHLEKLAELARVRIEYLSLLEEEITPDDLVARLENNYNSNYEFVAACGNDKDHISHSLLLILASLSPRFRRFFVDQETNLFRFRLRHDAERRKLVKNLKKFRNYLRSIQHKISDDLVRVLNVVQIILSEGILEHWLDYHRHKTGETACQVEILVPFQLALDLVSKREIDVQNGHVVFNCENFPLLMHSIFRLHLNSELEFYTSSGSYTRNIFSGHVEDERTKQLFRSLLRAFSNRIQRHGEGDQANRKNIRVMLASDVARNSSKFPLCMRNIHNNLVEGKKLKHRERFQFSLFLKEIGLPEAEAQKFWYHYYSRIKSDNGRESVWSERATRYTYSIRHLYGREGAGRDYSGAACASLAAHGSCPFAGAIEDLGGVLRSNKIVLSGEDQSRITSSIQVGDFKSACSCLNSCLGNKPSHLVQPIKPSQVYASIQTNLCLQ